MALCTTGEAVSVRNQIRKQVSRDRVGAKRTQRNGSWRRSAPFVFVEGNCLKGQEQSLSLRPLLALHTIAWVTKFCPAITIMPFYILWYCMWSMTISCNDKGPKRTSPQEYLWYSIVFQFKHIQFKQDFLFKQDFRFKHLLFPTPSLNQTTTEIPFPCSNWRITFSTSQGLVNWGNCFFHSLGNEENLLPWGSPKFPQIPKFVWNIWVLPYFLWD